MYILKEISPEEEGINLLWGILMNNLGYSLFRKGELLGQKDIIKKARRFYTSNGVNLYILICFFFPKLRDCPVRDYIFIENEIHP